MTIPRLRHAAVATLLILVPACTSSTAPPPGAAQGQFMATVSGAHSAIFSGLATSNGNWSAQFISTSGESTVIMDRLSAGSPDVGTYPIVKDDFIALLSSAAPPVAGDHTAVATLEGVPEAFFSTGGTLTIDSSTPSQVVGNLSFTARDLGEPPATITVTVEFTTTNR